MGAEWSHDSGLNLSELLQKTKEKKSVDNTNARNRGTTANQNITESGYQEIKKSENQQIITSGHQEIREIGELWIS